MKEPLAMFATHPALTGAREIVLGKKAAKLPLHTIWSAWGYRRQ